MATDSSQSSVKVLPFGKLALIKNGKSWLRSPLLDVTIFVRANVPVLNTVGSMSAKAANLSRLSNRLICSISAVIEAVGTLLIPGIVERKSSL